VGGTGPSPQFPRYIWIGDKKKKKTQSRASPCSVKKSLKSISFLNPTFCVPIGHGNLGFPLAPTQRGGQKKTWNNRGKPFSSPKNGGVRGGFYWGDSPIQRGLSGGTFFAVVVQPTFSKRARHQGPVHRGGGGDSGANKMGVGFLVGCFPSFRAEGGVVLEKIKKNKKGINGAVAL